MSEYQYYEFQAIDRPLTEREMRLLRGYSTRATITPSRFVNHYEWGNFKGNTTAWMEKYFDAFLYLANWGTHELIFRLPRRTLDLKTARKYLKGEGASAREKGGHVVLTFLSESEDVDGWDDDGSGWLSSLIPVRASIASGDLRALYVSWLLCAQLDELDGDTVEPPVPAGLGRLTAPLKAFTDFLRIDEDLVAVAAERSRPLKGAASRNDLRRWVATLPEAKKTDLLVRAARGEPLVQAEILRGRVSSQDLMGEKPRTVAELRSTAERRGEERRRMEAERAALERAHREKREAAERERYLNGLKKRVPATWQRVGRLVLTKNQDNYDEAVRLLRDLRDLGLRSGQADSVASRIRRIRDENTKKSSFIRRLERAGLVAEGPYASLLKMAGTAHSKDPDVSVNKNKHLAEILAGKRDEK
jgi:hypothetical protein